MTDVSSEAKTPSKKWLYASLALNLLLAGILVGGSFAAHRHHKGGRGHHAPPPMAVRDVGFAFMKSLTPERRAELFKKSGEKMRDARPLFEESMRLRKDAIAMLEQEAIDPAALKAAFAKTREADTLAQTRAGDAFADMVATLPAAERRAAVAKMRERWAAREAQRMERWGGRDGKGFGDGPPPPRPGEGPGPEPDGPPPPPRD